MPALSDLSTWHEHIVLMKGKEKRIRKGDIGFYYLLIKNCDNEI
jgi:hypothetical protein